MKSLSNSSGGSGHRGGVAAESVPVPAAESVPVPAAESAPVPAAESVPAKSAEPENETQNAAPQVPRREPGQDEGHARLTGEA